MEATVKTDFKSVNILFIYQHVYLKYFPQPKFWFWLHIYSDFEFAFEGF